MALPAWILRAPVPPPAFLAVSADPEAARSWARALFLSRACAARREAGCGACPACRALAAGTHADWVELAAEARGVDALRDLLRRLSLAPNGPVRVVFLAQVGSLSPAGAGALLKSVEEPPPATTFVLHADNPLRVLPTIRSRAFRVAVAEPPRPADAISEALLRATRVPRAWGGVTEALGKSTGKEAREILLARVRSVRRDLGPDMAAAARLAAFSRALSRETAPKLARFLLAPPR